MSKSKTPRYIFSIITERSQAGDVRHTNMVWRKAYGRPTTANLGKWVDSFEASCVNGPNKHLGIDAVLSAQIVDQTGGEIVAKWQRPYVLNLTELREQHGRMEFCLDQIEKWVAQSEIPLASLEPHDKRFIFEQISRYIELSKLSPKQDQNRSDFTGWKRKIATPKQES